MEIKNIIFDFDGTLMDTAPVILATMRETIDRLGIPQKTEQEYRATIGLRLVDIPAALYPEYPEIGDKYADLYRSIFNEMNSKVAAGPFPGVIETLRTLAAEGFRLAVASSRSHHSLMDYVSEFSLSEIFEAVIGGDDVTEGKPSPEPVLTICRMKGWKPDETLVVGDANYDILMGKRAGCRTIGVTYGNGTSSELKEAGADAVIDSFRDLPEALTALPK